MLSKTTKFIISVLIVGLIAAGGAYFWKTSAPTPDSDTTTTTTTKTEKDDSNVAKEPVRFLFYTGDTFKLFYKKGYAIQKPTETSKVLILEKSETQRIEIFSRADFGGKDRPVVAGSEPQEIIRSEEAPYAAWLFYAKGDTEAQAELKAIFDSIETL